MNAGGTAGGTAGGIAGGIQVSLQVPLQVPLKVVYYRRTYVKAVRGPFIVVHCNHWGVCMPTGMPEGEH